MFLHPQLSALSAILETGSFEAAAARLGVTPSAVSQRIRALEERVGGPVLTRSSPPEATVLGARIALHSSGMARLDAELADDLGGGDRLSLSIAVNADSLATWFLPALSGHDRRLVRVLVEDQDHSVELLRRGEVAAAVTARPEPVQGADCVALGTLRYIATASPGFAERYFSEGLTAEAFSVAPALVFNEKDALQSDWAAARTGRRVALPCHYLPSTRGFVEAAVLGIGWGMNPEPLVRDAIKEGRLVALDPANPYDTPLYWQSTRVGSQALQPLTLAVRRAAAAMLYRTE
jgi:LysR family transcriptional regulator (chromosome initiation inhibitor)